MAQQRDQKSDGEGPAGAAGSDSPDERLRRALADSAELLEANRRLRESAKWKDDLLAIFAEDFRPPVDLLLSQARLVLAGARGPLTETQRRALEAIERQGRRLLALSEEFLGLGALERERGAVDRQPTDLVELCGEVADEAAVEVLRERGGALVRSLPSYPVTLSLDGPRLRRVLATLVSDAVLAAPRGADVEIALEPGDDCLLIRVETSAADEEAAAGDRLRGARGPRGHGGSELGLAICRELIELEGGELLVDRAPAGGIRFTVQLPRAPGAGAAAIRPRAVNRRPRPRVLVVEDDPDAREALVQLLQGTYEVATASDGQEGIERVRGDPPDLVLMDLVMPRMGGFAALATLRADPRTAEVPVILISAQGDDITRVKGLDLGAVDFLQKPFSEPELKARMQRTLRLTQRQTQLRELAQTDTLTGLANLRAFRARFEEELKRARRYRTSLTCVMADMDTLKPINDELGHAAGDRAIAAIADVVRTELRETDFGARYGGDEFVVLLPHTTAAEGRIFALRVCARLAETSVEVMDRRLPLSACFGVAEFDPEAEEEAESLVLRADEALYTAKRMGRGQVAVHGQTPSPPLQAAEGPGAPG